LTYFLGIFMFYVYAGFDDALNMRSIKDHDQLYIVKFGFCDGLATWSDRFNDGYKNKETGVKESLPLALHKGWRRIATVEAGDWQRACPGLENPLKKWAEDKFGDVALAPFLNSEVEDAHEEWKPGTKANKNGLGELRHIPFEAVPNLNALMKQFGTNDELADKIVRQLGCFLEGELERFVGSLDLRRSVSRVKFKQISHTI
jgi:hypothetical protein